MLEFCVDLSLNRVLGRTLLCSLFTSLQEGRGFDSEPGPGLLFPCLISSVQNDFPST